MSHVFHRHTHATLPTVAAGEGPWLIDSEGRRYLDASGGAAVSSLGHNHPAVVRALHEQLDRIAFAHTAFFTNEPMERLATELTAAAPAGIDRAWFTSGGSEAIEAAIKLARQYFLEKGETERHRLVARRQSYHGNTLGALAAGGNEWRRQAFAPLLIRTEHIAPCYAWRDRRAEETDEAYGLRAAEELRERIEAVGPAQVMAFIAEPVVGATAGAVPPVPGYFRRIREICDDYGVLLILDEVMCGMGRTGTLFACEQDGVQPDMIAVAKGVGAGYQPLAALLVSGRIHDTIRDGSGFFQHGHTYMGHPMACAAGLAVLQTIRDDRLLERVNTCGEMLRTRLAERFDEHPNVGDIRGRGLFLGLELVRDRGTKTPFDPAFAVHARIKREAMARGLMCYPMGGTIDGRNGDHVLLAPPFIIEDQHIETIVERLGAAIDAAIETVRPRSA
jgi:adenosylmethionine-8-amino-7-oxononanoate aminotransferase